MNEAAKRTICVGEATIELERGAIVPRAGAAVH